jgi:tetratricopeptide (TPR) repeat protein
MISRRTIFSFFLLVIIVTGLFFSNAHVKRHRANIPAENQRAEVLMVSPALLKVISGEFKGLWADYLLLKASVFLGGYYEAVPEDWDAIYLMFKQSLTLDPYFFQTCYYTQGLFSWREGMHERAIELLKYPAKYRDWDWEPRFYIGFDYFYFLHDNLEGARYMGEAAKLPDAPPIVATLGARLAQREGRTEMAIALLHLMYDRAKDEELKKILEGRIKAHIGILSLERAIAAYKGKYGKKPGSLQALLDNGIVNRLPENPFGDNYLYDVETGRVFFDEIK